jgi:hypothetical protein
MIPNLENAIAFDFADDTVGCRDTVMRRLEHRRNSFWDWDGEDEEICEWLARYHS